MSGRKYKRVKLTLEDNFDERYVASSDVLDFHIILDPVICTTIECFCRREGHITKVNLVVVWDTLTQFHRWIIPRGDTKATQQVSVTSTLLHRSTVLEIVHTGNYHGWYWHLSRTHVCRLRRRLRMRWWSPKLTEVHSWQITAWPESIVLLFQPL
jgi:hypothetical protein